MFKDAGCFHHLNHEGGLILEQVVCRPDLEASQLHHLGRLEPTNPAKDLVDDPNLGVIRRNERTNLREYSDQSVLSEKGAFTTHVWSRKDERTSSRHGRVKS